MNSTNSDLPSDENHRDIRASDSAPVPADDTGSWYDFPRYYDLAFAEDTEDEAEFLFEVFQKFGLADTETVFECGCGSGRLTLEMATKGYQVTGFDLNDSMVTFAQERAESTGLSIRTLVANMVDFSLDGDSLTENYDGAFNMIDTFRHLLTEKDAVAHLKRVASHLRSGGVFVLGFHMLPPDADPECTEKWDAQDGGLSIDFTLDVIASSRETRIERMQMDMHIDDYGRKLHLQDTFDLRIYTAGQVRELFSAVPEFELVEVYDFWCDIDEPQPFDDVLVDAVFVLRKL